MENAIYHQPQVETFHHSQTKKVDKRLYQAPTVVVIPVVATFSKSTVRLQEGTYRSQQCNPS